MGLKKPSSVKTMKTLKDKAAKKTSKRNAKKDELARSTLTALAQLGYARAGLRDIAALSGVSLGVIHYYFEDKNELVSYAINLYKNEFITKLDANLLKIIGKEATISAIVSNLAETIDRHSETHRLWYDFRAQAMFEESFHKDVVLIESALIELLRTTMKLDPPDARQLYITIDAVFRYYIHQKLMQLPNWENAFRADMARVLACGVPK